MNIAVFISGNGSNLQAIIDAWKKKRPGNCRIRLVFSNKKNAYGLTRAKKAGIETACIEFGSALSGKEYFRKIKGVLRDKSIDLICLAGFMLILDKDFVKSYKGRILNIHPALLPKFGGKGMFGHNVHEAVIKAGEKYSGATVHFVDKGVDTGGIILRKKVKISKKDTAETLAKKVLKVEHQIYPGAIERIVNSPLKKGARGLL